MWVLIRRFRMGVGCYCSVKRIGAAIGRPDSFNAVLDIALGDKWDLLRKNNAIPTACPKWLRCLRLDGNFQLATHRSRR